MIRRWDIITIGNLSRNPYWGEGDDRAIRPALCTSTLVQGEHFHLLADPPIAEREKMAFELNRRTGLALRNVDFVFVTHEHGDHTAGLTCFPEAHWLAAAPVAKALNSAGKLPKAVDGGLPAAVTELFELIPTPGHTLGHHSLRFDCDGRSVVVAGDAVMTRDFWQSRRGFFNSADFEQAAETMDKLQSVADIIVPGHDNYFLTKRP